MRCLRLMKKMKIAASRCEVCRTDVWPLTFIASSPALELADNVTASDVTDKELVMKSFSVALFAAFLASSACAAEKPSQIFLKKAIEGNFAEVEMGKLAQQNGQNETV